MEIGGPYLSLSDDVCSQENGAIVLVLMAGEQGTHIRDDTPANTLIGQNQNRHHLSVRLYEKSVYRVRIQLDCHTSSSRSTLKKNCNLAQDVNICIDFNDNQRCEQAESLVDHRWPLRSSMPLGIYDFQVLMPTIDGVKITAASHRMRVTVTNSEEYRRKCAQINYSETRDYTIDLLARARHTGKKKRNVFYLN